ncbi:MAG TPA: hypothetical protein VH158_08820, partial [Gemmatimonadales bacterium]|nr:hypothetical protein [Gemmatimonadales bacterium]
VADLFCRQARARIRGKFQALWRNDDTRTYRLAQQVLQGEHRWLERGMVDLGELAELGAARGPAALR